VTETVKATKTVFTVSQFLDWQRQGTLDLNPIFQRRPVWKSTAKSLLVDSVARGFPIPIILLRQVQDLQTLSMRMEVVDGQQRLRTLLAFVDPNCLNDYDEQHDSFTVRQIHNADIARKPFSALSTQQKQDILSYELSTHVFPASTGDSVVFRIFARLNSTGLSLNPQEIRNSEYHGTFKSLVYELSFACFDYWRDWKLFSNSAISRMDEAEAVSEYLMAIIEGIGGKDQKRISRFYEDHDEEFSSGDIVRKRFESVIGSIASHFGEIIPNSAFQRPALFYSLFTAVYGHMYGLGSPLKRASANALPSSCAALLREASARIRSKDLPEKVQDAMDKATGDKARRLERHKFLVKALRLDQAG